MYSLSFNSAYRFVVKLPMFGRRLLVTAGLFISMFATGQLYASAVLIDNFQASNGWVNYYNSTAAAYGGVGTFTVGGSDWYGAVKKSVNYDVSTYPILYIEVT